MKSFFQQSILVCVALILLIPVKSFAESFMAFGDSLTMGLWVQPDLGNGRRVGGYGPHLEHLFGLVGRSAQVYNWGVGGETTLQALQGGKNVCTIVDDVKECNWVTSRTVDQAIAAQGGADYMLVLEGTNDFFAGISPQSTATNLRLIAEKGRNSGMTSLIATIPPDERGTGKDVYYINSVIKSVSQQYGFKVIDLHSGLIDNWAAYVGSDQLHPTQYGYDAMAKVWFGPFYNIQLTTGAALTYNSTLISQKAIMEGSSTANGDVLGVAFEYGVDTSMSEIVLASPESGSAWGGLSVTAEIEDLQPDTTYYYRMISTLDGATFYGETKTFTTSPRRGLSWLMLLLGEETP